jgi:hypothetical protein
MDDPSSDTGGEGKTQSGGHWPVEGLKGRRPRPLVPRRRVAALDSRSSELARLRVASCPSRRFPLVSSLPGEARCSGRVGRSSFASRSGRPPRARGVSHAAGFLHVHGFSLATISWPRSEYRCPLVAADIC